MINIVAGQPVFAIHLDSPLHTQLSGHVSGNVIDRQKIIEAVQGPGVDLLAAAAGILPPLGMVALDDALSPAVRFCVGDGGIEDGAGAHLAVKLRAGNER